MTGLSDTARTYAGSVSVENNVSMTTSDGVELLSDVYRPAARGRYPVVLMRVPYSKQRAQSNTFCHPARYAAQGYVVVVQDTRGRWASQGDFYPFEHEATDGAETVEWAASLPSSNGRVGMYGLSYAGATQLLAATQQPPSLRTICPGITSSQYYEGWTYEGGLLNLAFAASWATMLSADEARRTRNPNAFALDRAYRGSACNYDQLPLSEFEPLRSSGLAPYFFDWLRHREYDEYWSRWSIDRDYSRIDIPALHIGGWYDIFVKGTWKNFVGCTSSAGGSAARAGQHLLMGPWHHLTQLSGIAAPASPWGGTLDGYQLAWFDHHLKETSSRLPSSKCTVFLTGANTWVNLDDHQIGEPVDLWLGGGGNANASTGDGSLSLSQAAAEYYDTYFYDPFHPIRSLGGISCCSPDVAPMGAANQHANEILRDVLVYTSTPLPSEVTVFGPVSASLHVATSADDTSFVVKVCDVGPDGVSTNLVQAGKRVSADHGRLTPHRVYKLDFDLGPIGHVFKAGHSVRLQVTSSDFPHYERSLNVYGSDAWTDPNEAVTATQVVLHGGPHLSRVTLPVVDGVLA